MAKIANVFGRLEAFSLSVFLYTLGYIQMAGSNNVKTFASAQIFYSAGGTGLQILQQVFIADTSDLLNRALFSSLPDIPFLITVWVGSPMAQSLLKHTTWRWGYGLWAIVLPVAFSPLALALFLNFRKAKRQHLLPASPWEGTTFAGGLKYIWYELDVMGLLLLSAAISLILIPLTLAATAKQGWHNASIIAMIVIGCVCLVVFPMWESSGKLAPKPFMSIRMFTNRTVLAGCAIGFFYFGTSSKCIRSGTNVDTFQPSFTRPSFHTSTLTYKWSMVIRSLRLDTSLRPSRSPPLSQLSAYRWSSSTLAITSIISPQEPRCTFWE